MATFKIQSAMEYLMTYGWAILIIAVVLGALFGLGFFNSASLSPKVGPGACQVYRPQGPGSTAYINTEGVCSNEEPQFAAQFSGAGASIPGQITVSGVSVPPAVSYSTIAFWMYSTSSTSGPAAFSYGTTASNSIAFGATCFGIGGIYGISAASVKNTWTFVAVTFNSLPANDKVYINGAVPTTVCGVVPGAANQITPGSTVYIGGSNVASTTFNGIIANVQLYNYSLPTADILTLYQDGIGAVPQSLNNLVGWWPLNSNPYDYSGNLYNGVSANVVFTSSWTTSYTAP